MDDLERGVSLEEAFRQTLTETERTELDKYKEYRHPVPCLMYTETLTPYEVLHDKYHRIRQPRQKSFIDQLCSGERVAIGLKYPTTLSSRYKRIPAYLWRLLEVDFEKSEASGAGLRLVDIQVTAFSSVSDAVSLAASDSSPAQPVSSSEERIRLFDEGGILMIDEHVMLFGGDTQKSVIVQLVEGARINKPVWGLGMLKRAGSNSKSVEKLFKSNPNWGILSIYLKKKRGFYWLQLNDL